MNLILCEDGFVLDLPVYSLSSTPSYYLQSFHISACHYSVHIHSSSNLFERHRPRPLVFISFDLFPHPIQLLGVMVWRTGCWD